MAREAEHRFDRKVAWGVTVGERTELFTHLAVPVMTRLRQPERLVLDTLVAANVARSRADALAWCVRLVGRHTDDWLSDLRSAGWRKSTASGRRVLSRRDATFEDELVLEVVVQVFLAGKGRCELRRLQQHPAVAQRSDARGVRG